MAVGLSATEAMEMTIAEVVAMAEEKNRREEEAQKKAKEEQD